MKGRIVGAAASGVALACVLAGCSSQSHSRDEVDKHAVTAGEVMTQGRGPLPARAAAAQVTGHVNTTTIEATAAGGTTWGGSVTLRITVDLTGASPYHPDRTTRCFRYAFVYPRTSDVGTPHAVACSSAPAKNLAYPPLPTGVDATTRERAQRGLDGLGEAARDDPHFIRAALIAALGADYTVTVGTDRPHFVWVRYGEQCLTAQVSAAQLHVDPPRHGADCFGG